MSGGGTAWRAYVYSRGNLCVSEGGTANETDVGNGGNLAVESGGTANLTSLNAGGLLFVLDGGTANNTTISGGSLTVRSGGTANSTTVSSGGSLIVSSGGTADSTAVNSGGSLTVRNGGTANSTTVDGDIYAYAYGSLIVSEGGTANSTTVNEGGNLYVSCFGTANNTTVNDYGNLFVLEGGTADSTTVNSDGHMYVSCFGTANNTTVNYWLSVSSGGTATNTTVNNGTLEVESGGKLLGTLTIGGKRNVFVDEGSIIDFTVAGRTTEDDYLINDLSRIEGTPTFTITVTNNQAMGIYKLAQGAGSFTGTISINSNIHYDKGLTVNGDVLSINSMGYQLLQSEGNLTLQISDIRAPVLGEITASTTSPTNQSVILTVTATDNVAVDFIEYSLNGTDWNVYGDGVSVDSNRTVYFRATDTTGNISNVARYVVTNIDKTAPDAPTAVASITSATNQNVTVSAIFSEDSVRKQYSLDGENWFAYTEGIVFSANGTVYFRGTDAVGNVSTVTSYKVTNIDKVAPSKPTVAASTTAATNKNVTLTATFSSDSSKKQYSTDNKTWKTYSSAVSVGANGTYYFRGIDAAGNISTVTSYKVSNIDKVAPTKPTVKASTTAVTNKNVTLTATFSTDSSKKQYSTDNTTWKTYSSAVAVAANGTYYFRGIDAAGNISTVTSYKVTNIDKTAPSKPTVAASTTAATNKNITLTATFSTDSSKKQYSTDNTTWKTYSKALTVKANATYYFRGIDAAGNISAVKSYTVKNIDKTAPSKPTVSVSTTAMTNKSVTLTATFSSDSSKKQYSTDNATWKTYSKALTVKANATYYFRGIDAAGNISKVVSQKVSNICPKGDFTNDTLAAAGEKKALKLSSAQKITGWVGLGDPKDFIKLEVQKKGKVSLDMNAKTASAQKGGEVKLSLLNSAGKAVALSALDSDTLATKAKVTAGIYYLGVACANVKKYSTSYTVTAGMLAS